MEHLRNKRPVDCKYAVIHAESAVQLMLYEKMRSAGISLIDPKDPRYYKRFGTCLDDLKRCMKDTERADLEIIHEHRNLCQHRADKPDETWARWICTTVGIFLRRFCSDELGIDVRSELPEVLRAATEATVRDAIHHAEYSLERGEYETAIISAIRAVDAATSHQLEPGVKRSAVMVAEYATPIADKIRKMTALRSRLTHQVVKDYSPTRKEAEGIIEDALSIVHRILGLDITKS